MPGSMSRDDLVDDLKASLNDAASAFKAAADADFVRHLSLAAHDFTRARPLTRDGSVSLSAGAKTYAAPADLAGFLFETWSAACPQPWDPSYPGPLPRVSVIGEAGAKRLMLSPAPSALHIAALGADFAFVYSALHSIDADAAKTTIDAADRGLLLLRAQAEAMRELALRNVGKPVQMRDGLTGAPKNGTPAALYRALLDEFEARC